MPTIAFDALDYRADQSFAAARYRFDGDERTGWRIDRDGVTALQLGPGFRLLRVRQCGVCSTDLARHHLPFPLPQVIGHEVVAIDAEGRRYVVEINASHHARGIANDCAFCRAGLPTHCPERTTLGIHDLPGGFGAWILAPVEGCLEVPANVPDSAAVLVEPLAAALHAVTTIAPRAGESIAVLGPRRLGMLVIAALHAYRSSHSPQDAFTIAAVARDPRLLALAKQFGANSTHPAGSLADGAFDVVIDTTGNPAGLESAVRMARREVHLKSTHGQPSVGLHHTTELVVDEIGIARFPDAAPAAGEAPWERLRTGPRPRIAWLANATPPPWLPAQVDVQRGTAVALAAHYGSATEGLPRADVVVADNAAGVDAAIRPQAGREVALVRPRGQVLVLAGARRDASLAASPLLAAVTTRHLELSSSRCGDFRAALQLLAADAELRRIGDRLVTHHFPAMALREAFATARSPACIKAVVDQPEAGASA